MNNIEKKVDALIAALGFDVETTLDYQERKIPKSMASDYFKAQPFGHKPTKRLKTELGGMGQSAYLVDGNGLYTELLSSPVVNYKLTKRDANKSTQLKIHPDDLKRLISDKHSGLIRFI